MLIEELVKLAYTEDFPHGDLTTQRLQLTLKPGKALLVADEDLVLSGTLVFNECLKQQAPDAKIKWYFTDTQFVLKNQTIATLEGNLFQINTMKQVAVNFLSHFTGIATLTRCFVESLQNKNIQLLPLRNTTPLLRDLEFLAFNHGGGSKARRDLSHELEVQAQHLSLTKEWDLILEKTKLFSPLYFSIECETLEQLKVFSKSTAEKLILTHFSWDELDHALELIPDSFKVEVRGNFNMEQVQYLSQKSKVNAISTSFIFTHAPSSDIHLEYDPQ